MDRKRIIRNLIVCVLFFLTFRFGILPIITGQELEKRIRKTSFSRNDNEYGLVVFGTEPEGIAAALSAARIGIETLVVTEDPDPGSYIKSAMITYTSPDYAVINKKKTNLNTGIYTELFGDTGGNFSYEDYIVTVRQMLEGEPNITVLYNAEFLSAETEANVVKSVSFRHDGMTETIKAPYFIDATENGDLLILCGVPYFVGSEDINVPNAFMPVEFNFVLSNVSWDDVQSISKHSQNLQDFKEVLSQYQKHSSRIRISNISIIGQPNDEVVISGIRVHQVNVANKELLNEAFNDALTEAKMLTAFLKTAFVPFENCSFKTGPAGFYIPEYRHFEGRYTLTVEDILENRNFPTKIVMATGPIDADKFISAELSEEYTYILGNPVVYSIPLECFISKNYDNLLMAGRKASFSSLAATSAGRMPVSITAGHALGVTAAYCYINDVTPVELCNADENVLEDYQKLLKRSGITLMDFDEKNPNEGHWAWPSVKELVKYGLVAGGPDNDYLFDVEAYQENLVTLIINLIVKAAPEKYSLKLDSRIRPYATENLLTGEKACEIVLKALDIPFEPGNACVTAKENNIIPDEIAGKITPESPVTMDCVYVLTTRVVDLLKQ
jgi:hypothetical protein